MIYNWWPFWSSTVNFERTCVLGASVDRCPRAWKGDCAGVAIFWLKRNLKAFILDVKRRFHIAKKDPFLSQFIIRSDCVTWLWRVVKSGRQLRIIPVNRKFDLYLITLCVSLVCSCYHLKRKLQAVITWIILVKPNFHISGFQRSIRYSFVVVLWHHLYLISQFQSFALLCVELRLERAAYIASINSSLKWCCQINSHFRLIYIQLLLYKFFGAAWPCKFSYIYPDLLLVVWWAINHICVRCLSVVIFSYLTIKPLLSHIAVIWIIPDILLDWNKVTISKFLVPVVRSIVFIVSFQVKLFVIIWKLIHRILVSLNDMNGTLRRAPSCTIIIIFREKRARIVLSCPWSVFILVHYSEKHLICTSTEPRVYDLRYIHTSKY